MELIYVSLLLHKAGKEITEENIKKVLESVGIQKDDGQIKAVVAALANVDIEKAIKEAAAPVATAAPISVPAEGGEKKVEKKEEPKEDPEKAAAGLSSLFG